MNKKNTNKTVETIETVKVANTALTDKKPHFYAGNVKVGDMLTWNKLAGDTEFKGVMGSCAGHCQGCWNHDDWKHSSCYCSKSYVQYKDTVIDSHIVNTLAMRNDPEGTMKDLCAQLKRKRSIKPIRIHAAGELESVKEFEAWLWCAEQNPKWTFYVYTKAYDIVHQVLTVRGNLPDNFFLNISIWHEHGIATYNQWKDIPNVRAYAYDDETFDYEANGLHVDGRCPAYRKNEKGKVKLSHDLTCDKCKLCFQDKAKVLTCLSH